MQLKLVTLNIFQGELLDAAIEFLLREKPDIVTLQEVYDGKDPTAETRFRTFDELRARLGFPADDFVAAFIDNRTEGTFPEGNAILSRFPILARDAVFFNEPFRDDYVDDIINNPIQPHVLQHVTVETPAGPLDVYNLHGTWDLDGDNFSDKRRQMSEAVIAAVKDKTRVIVAGDTNAKPTNQAIRNIEPYIASVFGTGLASTFNMRRKDNPGYATAAVDMVFAGADLTVLSKDCPDVDVSDHRPLVVTFQLATANQEKDDVK